MHKTYFEHLAELKQRILNVFLVFVVLTIASYFYADKIYSLLLLPLNKISKNQEIIYTDLPEVFFSYLAISFRAGLTFTLPFIAYNVYKFIAPGLNEYEKKIARLMLIFSPLLFYAGMFFVFEFVIPSAWRFFVAFQRQDGEINLLFKPKISEYISLSTKFLLAFGVAFQLPIILVLLLLFKVISVKTLIEKRKIAIVVNFFIAAILTPPDVLSQFALAIPLLILYEISILLGKFILKIKD
ncbi:MAG: twin-arginine translocase subunit TatC [Rickettsiaceae bacterium]|nr:twin-arginine translocase subunit TatC [Rickettsiaceae bacterium]